MSLSVSIRIAILATTLVGLASAVAHASADGPHRDRIALVREGQDCNFRGDPACARRSWRALRALDPTDPAAPIGEVDTAYWQLMYDETDLSLDPLIRSRTAEAIRLAEARLERDADDADARHHLGRALMQLARLDATRGHLIRAGRAGERGRIELERALARDPSRVDARYPLGLYYYYASVLPSLLRMVDWLWFVPMGDRETGLRYLDEVAGREGVHRADAMLVLMSIHAYHEPPDLERALHEVDWLRSRYPDNALIHFERIDVLFQLERYGEAVAEAHALERTRPKDRGSAGRVALARAWRGRALLQMRQPDAAWEAIASVSPDDPDLPGWGVAWVELVRAQILDVHGRRDEALRIYHDLLARPQGTHFDHARRLAEEGASRPFDPTHLDTHPSVSAAP